MSDFTPGPWQYIHPAPLSEGMRIFSSNKYIGFVGNTDMSVDEMNANAQLIAAAPDMYEVLSELEESSSYWSEYDVPIGIAARILAALKKARGEV